MWKMQQHFPQYSEINICSCLVFFKMCFSSVKKRKIQKLLKQKEKIKIKYNPTTPKLPLLNVWYTLLALFLSIQALFPVLHFVVVFYEFYKFMSSINFCTDYTWIFCFVWLLFFCCLFCFHFFVLFCFVFGHGTVKQSLLNLLQYCFRFMFWSLAARHVGSQLLDQGSN